MDIYEALYTTRMMRRLVFAIDDLGGANIYPAIWSVLLAARAKGVPVELTAPSRS